MNHERIEREDVEAARGFVEAHFPNATAALLGGAFIRGEGTPWSDLDIIVIESDRIRAGRMNRIIDGWFFDVIVHSRETAFAAMQEEALEGVPFTATLIAESVVLIDRKDAIDLHREATTLAEARP